MLQTRVEKLRKILKEKNLDGFLVSNFFNILYLTGFKTLTEDEREAWSLITKDNIYLFTDSRYIVDNKLLTPKLITPTEGLINHLMKIAGSEKMQRMGFEEDDLKVNEFQRIRKYLTDTELIPFEKLILKIREIKDLQEINDLKKSCQIADDCLREVAKTIRTGTTEKEIAFKIEFWLKEKGYDMAFYPIVAIDKNSAVPHHDTRVGNNEKVKKNSIILIDYGAKFNGYHSDITRMIFVGKPTDKMTNIYKALLNAQEKTIEQLKIDNNPVSLDQFCRKVLSEDYESQTTTYSHSTGHGVGLQIHEFPKISFTSTDVLLPNQVITIEPGVYLNDKWGMRIEDTVLIKDNKEVEVLTKFSKKFLII